jgi:hypothetical protein
VARGQVNVYALAEEHTHPSATVMTHTAWAADQPRRITGQHAADCQHTFASAHHIRVVSFLTSNPRSATVAAVEPQRKEPCSHDATLAQLHGGEPLMNHRSSC